MCALCRCLLVYERVPAMQCKSLGSILKSHSYALIGIGDVEHVCLLAPGDAWGGGWVRACCSYLN